MIAKYSPFVYTPLLPGEIRLLSPTNNDEWLLKTVRIKDDDGKRIPVEYDALSYSWGDLSRTFPITCDSQELQVHHNLNVALPYLAKRDSKLPIWIDAICINQSDDAEKVPQLKLMQHIYTEAEQVWVWFGPGNEESENVIKMLPQIIESKDESFESLLSKPKKMPWLSSSNAWDSFYDLVENEWYSRLWIYQETAFAKTVRVLLGKHEVSWDTLRKLSKPNAWQFADVNGKRPRMINKWANNVFRTRTITRKAMRSRKPLTAEEVSRILNSTMSANCREPRDRVFAHLGFVSITVPDEITLEKLYIHLARVILLCVDPSSKHFWLFLHMANSANKLPSLPSWCPDFHDVAGRALTCTNVASHQASTRKNKTQNDFDLSRSDFAMRGQIFDTIEVAFDAYIDDEGETSDRLRAFHKWEAEMEVKIYKHLMSRLGGKSGAYQNDEDAIRLAYWSTLWDGMNVSKDEKAKSLMAEMTYKSMEDLHQGQYEALWMTDRMESFEQLPFYHYAHEEPDPKDFQQVVRHMAGVIPIISNIEQRQIFVTSQGRIGCGAGGHLRVGDEVCIFSFATHAHVIRRTVDTEKTTHTFIGPAYVHGMMYGEIEELNLEERDIVLV